MGPPIRHSPLWVADEEPELLNIRNGLPPFGTVMRKEKCREHSN
jgi:hypothetical protein